MKAYESKARFEMNLWKEKMRKKPSMVEKASKGMQNRFNSIIPEKFHEIVTSAIKNMTKAVLLGSKFTTKPPMKGLTLEERERLLKEKTKVYVTTALIEGAATGAGGFVAGMADFPLLLSIKFKFLYEVASIYGFDVDNYTERLYILHIFQLAFSSKAHMNKIFHRMENWDDYINHLPIHINQFEWREFQQEYRDYLDISKLFQMLPIIGAAVGSYVNQKLMKRLSLTAANAYRMRILK